MNDIESETQIALIVSIVKYVCLHELIMLNSKNMKSGKQISNMVNKYQ